jgi:hypothetical protein
MASCIDVALASVLDTFKTAGRRREAAKAAVKKQKRSTGPSSSSTALGQADGNAREVELAYTSFFKLHKAGRLEIIRHLQRRYQGDVVVASREAFKAEAAAWLARLRQSKQDHKCLRAARCDKHNEFIKIKPCRSEADLQALLAVYRKCDPASTRSRTWA